MSPLRLYNINTTARCRASDEWVCSPSLPTSRHIHLPFQQTVCHARLWYIRLTATSQEIFSTSFGREHRADTSSSLSWKSRSRTERHRLHRGPLHVPTDRPHRRTTLHTAAPACASAIPQACSSLNQESQTRVDGGSLSTTFFATSLHHFSDVVARHITVQFLFAFPKVRASCLTGIALSLLASRQVPAERFWNQTTLRHKKF